MKDTHLERMKEISRTFAPPDAFDSNSFLYKQMSDQRNDNPIRRKEIKRRYQHAVKHIEAQLLSGPGKIADEAIRAFLAEYNHRLFMHGPYSMPCSFNVMESFVSYNAEYNFYELLPEQDYLFLVEDFFDFITHPDVPSVSVEAAKRLREGVIHNYSAIDEIASFPIHVSNDIEYVVAGASMVRRGSELTVLLIAGEAGKIDELKKYSYEQTNPVSGRDQIIPDRLLPCEPVMLEQAEEYVKSLAVVRLDLDAEICQVRYLLRDAGQFYDVLTDDPASTCILSPEESTAIINASSENLNMRAGLWEIAKTLVMLPAYMDAKIEFVKQETATTAMGKKWEGTSKERREVKELSPKDRIFYRHISAVRILKPRGTSNIVGRSYTPPKFQVPVKGFWRHFTNPTRLGHDEDGKEIEGKTWVKSHVRYVEKPEAPKIVYIKSSLANARRQLERFKIKMQAEKAAGNMMSPIPGSKTEAVYSEDQAIADAAYLYVMRCPAHGRDIYKVGYTDRDPESRARELSASTASPVPFLVVQAWAVTKGNLAEDQAHSALEKYRLAQNREFFVGAYHSIRERIEIAIRPFLIEGL